MSIRRTIRPFLLPLLPLSVALFTAALLFSCASIGNPSGGPRDEDPPRFVSASPSPGSVNVDPEKINILFDEIVNVKDAYDKVVVSPPLKSVPRVTSSGRRITVNFNDTLKPNTTYTIDFSNAIEDNNEGNKLQGFTYTFSTGPDLDTLSISGMVLSARNLEPMQGVLVGAHSNLNDTAFTRLPFERMAKTDDRGRFVIRGLKQIPYLVYALQDKDNDYKYANADEDLAYIGAMYIPYSERVETQDTIWNLRAGTVDTVVSRMRTRFLPNDVLLRSFNSEEKPQYLVKYERVDSTRLSFIFNTKAANPPILKILGADSIAQGMVREGSLTNDTVIYWLRDMKTVRTDSLRVVADYLRTDTAGMLSPFSDSLNFYTSRPKTLKAKKGNKRKEKEVKISAEDSIKAITLGMKVNNSTTIDMFEPITIEFATPLERLDSAAFHLMVKTDSVFRPVPGEALLARRDSLSPRIYKIEYPWEYGGEYSLQIDTLAATGIYGKPTRPLKHDFKVKNEEDYCSMTFNISDFGDVPAFVELLNASDDVVRTAKVEDGSAFFPFLSPGKYYARIIEDHNGNGIYDTGNFEKHLQPDMAYYYPKAVNIKKNWDKTENWNVFETAIDLQKPENLKKNKPEAGKNAKKNNNNKENEDDEDDGTFDPNRNPFDPNYKSNKTQRLR